MLTSTDVTWPGRRPNCRQGNLHLMSTETHYEVRYGGKLLEATRATDEDGALPALVAELSSMTNVPVERIKLTARGGARVRTSADLQRLGSSVKLMMVGSAVVTPSSVAPAAATTDEWRPTAYGTAYVAAWAKYWCLRLSSAILWILYIVLFFLRDIVPCCAARPQRRRAPHRGGGGAAAPGEHHRQD